MAESVDRVGRSAAAVTQPGGSKRKHKGNSAKGLEDRHVEHFALNQQAPGKELANNKFSNYFNEMRGQEPVEKKLKSEGSEVQTCGSLKSSHHSETVSTKKPSSDQAVKTKPAENGKKKKGDKVVHSDASDEEDDDINVDDDDVDVDDDDDNQTESVKSDSSVDHNDNWKLEDNVSLLEQIKLALPADDNDKYSTMVDKLDWTKVSVRSFTSTACKEQWLYISNKLRLFRTMTELVSDAMIMMKIPKNALSKKQRHPDMPKKPLTPYFRFFVAKREKYSARHPELSATDLTKELSKKFAKLPEEKKQKYQDEFNLEMAEYKKAMEVFREKHPGYSEDDGKSVSSEGGANGVGGASSSVTKSSSSTGPPKTVTAVMIYINEMCEEEKKNKSKLTRRQLYDQYRDAWFQLSDHKKLPYIYKAVEAKEQYDIDVLLYRQIHPDFNPRSIKTFLTKAEQKIKDKVDGKPEKPPGNGYSLFTLETLPLLTDLPNMERMVEVSKRWKKLSDEKREAFNTKAEERNQEYKIKYEKYLQTLTPEARRKEEDNDKQNVKKKLLPSAAILNGAQSQEKRTKPVAAVFLYIEDQRESYKSKHPDVDDSEIQRQLVKQFTSLSDKEKARYKQMEEKAKEKIAAETAQAANVVVKKPKKIVFAGEPPLPPHSGYQLFSKEMLLQLKNVKANERLQEIGRRWSALSETEKHKFNKRKDAIWVEYRKDVERFKKTLSKEKLAMYEEVHKPSKKKKKTVKEEVSADDKSSSSSITSSDDDDDDDDDDDEGVVSSEMSEEEKQVKLDESSSSDESSSDVVTDTDDDDDDDDDVEDMIKKQPVQPTPNNATTVSVVPVKPGKLSAAEVYQSEDSDSSITSSDDEDD